MKKTIFSLLLMTMFILTTVSNVSANERIIKSTGKDAATFLNPCDVFGGAYCNDYQIPEASGKVNLIQPNGNVDVILGISVDGLLPETQYRVIFGVYGDWDSQGYFYTDEYGSGEFNYTAPAGAYEPGQYDFRVWINRYDPNATIFVSEFLSFEID